MIKRKTLRKIHIYSGIISSLLGVYLWLEPKWRRMKRKGFFGRDADGTRP